MAGTRVVIVGVSGRMGQALVRVAGEFPQVRITGAVASAGSPSLGRDAAVLAGMAPMGIEVTHDLPAALAAGVRATFAFPLLVGAARFGVLHLHSPRVRTLTTREIAISLLLTELAMEIVLDAFAPVGEPMPSKEPLLGSPDRRDQIYQAQGMLMVELGISLEEALARMRALAFSSGQELANVAADIVARRTHLEPDPDGAG